jgi:hypothetical protein
MYATIFSLFAALSNFSSLVALVAVSIIFATTYIILTNLSVINGPSGPRSTIWPGHLLRFKLYMGSYRAALEVYSTRRHQRPPGELLTRRGRFKTIAMLERAPLGISRIRKNSQDLSRRSEILR